MIVSLNLLLSKKYKYLLSNLLYSSFASKYDIISYIVSKGYWCQWQLNALNEIKGHIILDVACGTGRFIASASKHGYSIFGFDRSRYMLKACTENAKHLNLKVRLVQSDNTAIPVMNESIDSVIITFPTDFVLDEILYKEVFRVLKIEGRLIIIDFPKFHIGFINSLFNIMLNLLDQKSINDVINTIPKDKFKIMTKTVKEFSSSVKIIIADKLYHHI